MGQHAGGGTLRLILGILRGVQRQLPGGLRSVQRPGQGTCAPRGAQSACQRVRLKALQHHERIDSSAHARLEQYVARMARGGDPLQRDARHHGLVAQGAALPGQAQQRPLRFGPGRALRRGNGGCHGSELGGGLQQGRGQHVLLCAQTGLRQQAARREAVARHVHGQV